MMSASRAGWRGVSLALAAVNLLLLSGLARPWWWGALAGGVMALLLLGWQAWLWRAAQQQERRVQELVSGVLPLWERNVELADSQMQEAVDALVQRFAQLAERLSTAGAAEPERQQLGRELNELLVYLQFQDRVNQILGHVRADMRKLERALADGGGLPSREQWLEQLQRSYTTLEQRALHPEADARADDSSQITFF